jgi:predicted  nucleic acid-binding Zn-ribbon protein
VAVTSLTGDGACGHCFGMIPLQVQNEIRTAKALIPCEFCGVLLGPADELA